MALTPANLLHKQLKDELAHVLQRYTGTMKEDEVLAVMAQMVGMTIALQDQRKITSEQALEIVSNNIEIGNQVVIDELMNSKGNA